MQEHERNTRPVIVRFVTCLVRGHVWDPYPGHLQSEGLMECTRCGLRAKPVQGLQT